MYDAMGIITNRPENNILGDITKQRSLNTVPFGGRYRLIDFALSNMVNSGIKQIGVIGSNKYPSIVDHLGTGEEWSLSRKSEGLSILNSGMFFYVNEQSGMHLHDFSVNRQFFQNATKKNVVISGSDIINNMNFKAGLAFHEEQQADITMFYKEINDDHAITNVDTLLNIDKATHKVIEICKYPHRDCRLLFIDMLIIKRDMLLRLIDHWERYDVNGDLMNMIATNLGELNTYAYPFTGYYSKVSSIKKYFDTNMDLLERDIMKQLFLGEDKIYTRINETLPTKYRTSCQTNNVLVASGCVLDGYIERSIVFPKVKVGKGTAIENTILMENSEVGENAILENVILDMDVKISPGVVLKGRRDSPLVIGKNCCLG